MAGLPEVAQSNSERKRLLREQAAVAKDRAERAELGEITAHRAEELYWKSRNPHPDWTQAFCGSSVTECDDTGTTGMWYDRHGRGWQMPRHSGGIISFLDRPGLFFLPGHLSPQIQARLVKACLTEATGPACRTNLDTHYNAPARGWWREYCHDASSVIQPRVRAAVSEPTPRHRTAVDLEPMSIEAHAADRQAKEEPQPGAGICASPVGDLIRKLRWSIIGLEYHWGTKSYKWDEQPMPMPPLVSQLSSEIVSNLARNMGTTAIACQGEYRPEAGVVNFYQYRDALTAHVDQSEVDAVKPLVSISLGPSAVFLVGGPSRKDQPIPLLLQSGDVVVMSGPSRRVFHGVPRIRDDVAFSGLQGVLADDSTMLDFIRTTRINVNVRHVFPG